MKITISEVKKWLDSLNSTLETGEERASEFIDKSLESIQKKKKEENVFVRELEPQWPVKQYQEV